MANKPLPAPLPADLPEDWTSGQIVAPAGADVGLSEQHGYNYQSKQINAAQRAVNQIREVLETGDIENTVTVEGGGHMDMGESLGGPPYEITVTEETDAPLTADDVGAIPLPDNPVKGQALIFDGSGWVPGDVTTELPVASAVVLGGVKVGESLEIDKGVLDAKYIQGGKTSGSFSSSAPVDFTMIYSLMGWYRPLALFKITLMNTGTVTTDFTVSLAQQGTSGHGATIMEKQNVAASGGISRTFVASYAQHAGWALLGDLSGEGHLIRMTSSAGVGTYEIEVVGVGPEA